MCHKICSCLRLVSSGVTYIDDLKKAFNVTKYTKIKHTDFQSAYDFLAGISYQDFTPKELRATQKQLELMELER